MTTVETVPRPDGTSFLESCDQTQQPSAIDYLSDAIAAAMQPDVSQSLTQDQEEE